MILFKVPPKHDESVWDNKILMIRTISTPLVYSIDSKDDPELCWPYYKILWRQKIDLPAQIDNYLRSSPLC